MSRNKKIPTVEEIEAMEPEELCKFLEAMMPEAFMPPALLCPVSGMGREIAEWDKCAGEGCAWYHTCTTSVDKKHGCCPVMAIPE